MAKYAYSMKGTAAGGQSWHASGEVQTALEGDFPLAIGDAQRDAFMQLTRGKAVFGHPGLGCAGPYTITEFTIQRI